LVASVSPVATVTAQGRNHGRAHIGDGVVTDLPHFSFAVRYHRILTLGRFPSYCLHRFHPLSNPLLSYLNPRIYTPLQRSPFSPMRHPFLLFFPLSASLHTTRPLTLEDLVYPLIRWFTHRFFFSLSSRDTHLLGVRKLAYEYHMGVHTWCIC